MTVQVKATKSIRIAYGEALAELGAEREDIVVLDADLAHATTTAVFGDKFPQRFFNMGIAEQNLISVAGGLSISGFIPFASTFAMFGAGRGFEQMRNTVCYPNLNVKLALSHSGVSVGEDGGSHQAVEDISLMRSIPHMTVLVPCDAIELGKLLRAAVDYKGPVYIRVARPPAPVFTDEKTPFEIGKGIVMREGKDVAIIATGLLVYQALLAADELSKSGIEATVVDMHTIKPIDSDLIVRLSKSIGTLITAEEHSIVGGLGTAVAEVLAEKAPARLRRIGLPDCFGQSGTPDELFEYYGLTAKNIVEVTRQTLAGDKQ